jgi:hypothetical protein
MYGERDYFIVKSVVIAMTSLQIALFLWVCFLKGNILMKGVKWGDL